MNPIDHNHNTLTTDLREEIEKLRGMEQNCLKSLAECDQRFGRLDKGSEHYQKTLEETGKFAEVGTYTWLFVSSLLAEKTLELAQLESQQAQKSN